MRQRRGLVALTAAVLATTGAGVAAASGAGAASARCPWVGSTAPVEQRVAQVLSRMREPDKLAMVHGITEPEAMAGLPTTHAPAYVGVVPANPRLCVPALNLEDGPAGVGDAMTGVTQLPAPVSAAASFDPALARGYGAVTGAEQRGKGVDVGLGPTVNIVRDPRWGRAFESLGEDPYLAGQLGAANIAGVQSQGVIAQVKHFAVYNQELGRDTPLDNAVIASRPLHEIYLPAFQAAVTQGHVGSAMCSYNEVNGTPACQNPYLLSQVLAGELGFDGFVTSDWLATQSSAAAADAGLDMQMPDGCYFGPQLQRSIDTGRVPQARLDDMVRRVLRVMFRAGLFDHRPVGSPQAVVTTAAHAAFARRTAEQGTVLLKNAGHVLPLDPHRLHRIAVIGADAAAAAVTAGGGSAAVRAPYVSTPLDAIRARAGHAAMVTYDDGSNPASAARVAGSADVAVVFAALKTSESEDLSTISLPGTQNQTIEAVARANPRTVVVLNTASAVTMPWLAEVRGVLEAWYPGQEDGRAAAAVLFGDVDPGGRLPVTFPRDLSQVPARTPAQWPGVAGRTQYSEGLLVGYRWYDEERIAPLFPFGFGLSYTTFRLDRLRVSTAGAGRAGVSVRVTNTGRRRGSEVVQVYVAQPSSAGEPPHQLAAFAKVDLRPGAAALVRLPLGPRAFSHWDVRSRRWVAPAGTYTVLVGTSSRSLPLRAVVRVPHTVASGRGTPPPPRIPASATAPATRAEEATSCPKDAGAPWLAGLLSVAGSVPQP